MGDYNEPDYGVVYYRSKDSLNNFRIHVTFKRATTSSLLSGKFGGEDPSTKSSTSIPLKEKRNPEEFIDTYTFKWQEKVFNKTEFEKYSQPETRAEPYAQGYATIIAEQLTNFGGKRPTKRLFSYIIQDNYQEHGKNFVTHTSENESPLVTSAEMMRARKGAKHDKSIEQAFGAGSGPGAGIPRLNILENDPTPEHIRKQHFMIDRAMSMYIMADLGPLPDEDPAADFQLASMGSRGSRKKGKSGGDAPEAVPDENANIPVIVDSERYIVLCKVSIDKRGMIAIRPDFSYNKPSYKIQSPFSARDLYEFTLENVSKDISQQEHERELRMHQELYARHAEFLLARVGNEFEMPPPSVLRVLVQGEIMSACNFEYDDLYVHYLVELPKNWFAFPNQPLAGTTNTCSYGSSTHDDQAYFSYPFELQLFYKNVPGDDEDHELNPQWPVIFFEINSQDWWTRHRTEGYGYTVVPPRPGLYQCNVHCWRPVGSSIFSEMRRFFVGGPPELEDPTYPFIPTAFEGKTLSKLGFRTESTGSIQVRLYCMHQSQNYLEVQREEQNLGQLRGRLAATSQRVDITNVIEAFKRSRERLQQVRHSVRLLTDDVDKLIDDLHLEPQAGASVGGDLLGAPEEPAPTHLGVPTRARNGSLLADEPDAARGPNGTIGGTFQAESWPDSAATYAAQGSFPAPAPQNWPGASEGSAAPRARGRSRLPPLGAPSANSTANPAAALSEEDGGALA